MITTICLFVSISYGNFCFTPEIQKPKFDIYKLSYAVARQETGGCTTGVARFNNCHGFMKKVNGVREPMKFATKEDSHKYFVDLWTRKYGGGFPTLELAKTYVGESDAQHWLNAVNTFYYK